MMIKLLFFIFYLFFIFGPKIGFIDLSILVPCLILPFLLQGYNKINLNSYFFGIIFLIFILLLYQISLQLFYSELQVESILRLVRALLVSIISAIVVSQSRFTTNHIISFLFYVILFHAILINIAAIYYPINEVLSFISGNDRIKPFRASGLLAGFDMAGFFCVIGLLMLIFNINFLSIITKFISYIVFLSGCYFTSRVSIFLGLLCIVFMGFRILFTKKISIISRIFMGISTLFCLGFGIYLVLPIFEASLSLGIIELDQSEIYDISTTHSLTSHMVFMDMLFLPDSSFEIIFGTGAETFYSDIGYIKDIYRYGIIGLTISILTYVLLLNLAVNKLGLLISNRNLKHFIIIIFFLIFILTLKNNYIFTRGIFPFFMLIVVAAFKNNYCIVNKRDTIFRT